MKSVILIACLIVSASCAPQKSAGLEREESKSAKLQFTPADAQVYSSANVPETVAASQGVVYPSTYVADKVVPYSYGSGSVYGSGSGSVYGSGYVSDVNSYTSGVNSYVPSVVPYGNVGRPTVTGLPANTVYEHQGQSHVGHSASTVHIKRPINQYYANRVSGLAVVPAHHLSQGSWNSAASYSNGQIQYINGQPAQYVNGQWYYVDAAQIPAIQDQYAYTSPLNRPSVVPGVKKYYNQAGSQWQSGILGARPSTQWQDTKWYTKTNTQGVVSPFYGQPQPQYSPFGSAAVQYGTKSRAIPKPVVQSEGERSDW